ncbi:MAG: FixH family protein [Deltaproteobacteria bacterium]|jgi:hypothetical protein|nr:FixH family protein [Deltaproteobacteria bacterium]
MNKIFYTVLLAVGFATYVHACPTCEKHKHPAAQQKITEVHAKNSVQPTLLKEGQKIIINDSYSFKYNFAEKPKMGQSVLKIQVLDANGKTSSNLKISATYDMPSMRGHHATKVDLIQKNKKGVYLLPVNFVMQGDWEIVLTFKDTDKNIFVGVINLEI